MRYLIAAAALLGLSLLPASPALAAKLDKVGVCHEGDAGYVYIVVNAHALKHGHTVEKGDVLGLTREACDALNAPKV